MKKIIWFLFISMAFCSEEKNFTFKYKYYEGQKVKYKKETMIIMEIPVVGEFRMGENYSVIDEYLGEKDGFYILQKTIKNVISSSVLGDRVTLDRSLGALSDIPCRLYIDSDGKVDHVEPVGEEYSYLEEDFEMKYMGMDIDNSFFPFGKNAKNISIGDSWTDHKDSISIVTADNMSGLMSFSSVYTLDKVKAKKGVAYISEVSDVSCKMFMFIGDEIVEMHNKGTWETSYKYDIAADQIISIQSTGDMLSEYEMFDKTLKTPMVYIDETKRVK